jgi:hypothetical protein
MEQWVFLRDRGTRINPSMENEKVYPKTQVLNPAANLGHPFLTTSADTDRGTGRVGRDHRT